MKTIEPSQLQADPVISEVRRTKVALAEKYGFDVVAMVRALQEREKKLKCEGGPANGSQPVRSETNGT